MIKLRRDGEGDRRSGAPRSSEVLGAEWLADTLLNVAAHIWLGWALLAQILFLCHTAVLYSRPPSSMASPGIWRLFKEYAVGDPKADPFYRSNTGMAALTTCCALIYLASQIGKSAPVNTARYDLRRIAGNALMILVGIANLLDADYRSTDLVHIAANGLNAALLIGAAVAALRAAAESYGRWVLRVFILASGHWFFRVGTFAWVAANLRPAGMTENADGPFDRVLDTACYLLPLFVLELYFYTREKAGIVERVGLAGLLVTGTVSMNVGMLGEFLLAHPWLKRF